MISEKSLRKLIREAFLKREILNETIDLGLAVIEEPESGRILDHGKGKDGRMSRSKLFRTAQMAQSLHDRLQDEDDLPGWAQDKITTVEDRLQSVYDYMIYKLWRLKNG